LGETPTLPSPGDKNAFLISWFAGGGKNSAKVRGFQPLTFAKSSPLPAHGADFSVNFDSGEGLGWGKVKVWAFPEKVDTKNVLME